MNHQKLAGKKISWINTNQFNTKNHKPLFSVVLCFFFKIRDWLQKIRPPSKSTKFGSVLGLGVFLVEVLPSARNWSSSWQLWRNVRNALASWDRRTADGGPIRGGPKKQRQKWFKRPWRWLKPGSKDSISSNGFKQLYNTLRMRWC